MENIIVREYVHGDIKCNVFKQEIAATYSPHVGRRKVSRSLARVRKIYLTPKYRLDCYTLDAMSSKLIRNLYGKVEQVIYQYYFVRNSKIADTFNCPMIVTPVKSWETDRAFFYEEWQYSGNVAIRKQTIIIKLKDHG
jgi:hypothetical protein